MTRRRRKALARLALAPVLGVAGAFAVLGAAALVIGGPAWLIYRLVSEAVVAWLVFGALAAAAAALALHLGYDLARRVVR